MTDEALEAVEQILGYSFEDPDLLRRALRHASVGEPHNEPLACLGDRIHGVWAARRIFHAMPKADKATLTWFIHSLTDGDAQACALRDLGLGEYVALGGSIRGAGGTVTPGMASTAFEALVAVIELDGGIVAAEAFLDRVFGGRVLALPGVPMSEGPA
jgi:ribonuclease III